MKKILWALAAVWCFSSPAIAADGNYPEKPIQLVIVTTPGTTSDIVARFLGAKMGHELGQPFVVVSKPSENNITAGRYFADAAPDGYTLLLGGNTVMAGNVHLFKELPYDPRDFEGVSLTSINPLLLVVRSDLPINNVSELIAYGKARPGELNYGVGNSGGKVATKLLMSKTGFDALEVPFRGTSQAIQELVAGRLDFMIVDPLVADAFVKQGKLRPLAVTTADRLPSLSEVPTMQEAGVQDYDYSSFVGFFAPKGTPEAVLAKLNTALVNAVQSEDAKVFYDKMGMIAKTSTVPEAKAFVQEQIALWGELVRVAGIEPQ